MFDLKLKLAGSTFKNPDGSSRMKALLHAYDNFWSEARERDVSVELRRDPENRFDPHAIAVWLTVPGAEPAQVGYVSSEQNQFVGQAMEAGRLVSVKVDTMAPVGRGSKVAATLVARIREGDSPAEAGGAKDEGPSEEIEDDDGRVFEFD